MKVSGRIGVSVLIILFVTVSLSYGQSLTKQSYTKGIDYAAQGKFKEAKEEFEKVLKADPFYEPAKEALKVMIDVIDRKIESEAVIHLFKGGACRLKGQTDEAIVEYNKALEISPKLAMAYYARGKAYCIKRQYDHGISDLNKAIELNPRFHSAYLQRGFSYAEGKGQFDKAISDYTKAIE